MGMMVGQSKPKKAEKAQKKQDAQPPNGQVQMVTMEQAILNSLGLIQRTVANIERQQLILGGKIDACYEKLNE